MAPRSGTRLLSRLGLRLLAAFLAVAAVAIGVFAGLTLWASRGEVDDLVRRQQQETLRATTGELADAYREAGTWAYADLRAGRALAVTAGALLEVRDADGAVVLQPGQGFGPGREPGRGPGLQASTDFGLARTAPIVVAGEHVGTVSLRFRKSGLPPAEQQLRDALTRTTLVGIAIGGAAALLAGLLVTHAVTRPLRRLTDSVRRLGAGERDARANLSAPGELGELAEAVDRMAESLEHEDELRRTLTADVAHELRTPVTILTAQLEALADGVVEPTPEHLDSLHQEVLRLGRVIEDVEAIASAEAAGLRLERSRVDFADVTGSVVDLHAPRFDVLGVELDRQLEPGSVVVGDEARLGQVVRNLLENALKFTPAGGRVDVELGARDGSVRLTVRDTGVGIPADELPHVFERFWRGRDARGAEGSGVGLAVVDELVRAHGGRVEVVSEEGAGSAFTVELPRA